MADVSWERERVAFDLYTVIRNVLPVPSNGQNLADTAKKHLDLYAECLRAVRQTPYDTTKLT